MARRRSTRYNSGGKSRGRSNTNNSAGARAGRPTQSLVRKWEVNGLVQRPSVDPTPITETPWNSATLEYVFPIAEGGTEAYLSINSVYVRLREQLGVQPYMNQTGGFYHPLVCRFQECKAWNLSREAIELSCSNLLRATADQSNALNLSAQIIKDFPGQNHFAAVGYTWPRSHQVNTFQLTDGANFTVAQVTAVSGSIILFRVKILWRGISESTASIPPALAYKDNTLPLITNAYKFHVPEGRDPKKAVLYQLRDEQGGAPATLEPVATR